MSDFTNLKGATVDYSPHPGYGTYFPALVVHAGDETLECLVWNWDGASIKATPRSGVRHEADEKLKDPVFLNNLIADGEGGVFRIPLKDQDIEARLAALEAAISSQTLAPKGVKVDTGWRDAEARGEKLTPAQKADKALSS
jgi:hypothetical protein